MKVKCRSNKDSFLIEYSNITVGEIYNVISLSEDYSIGTDVYTIIDDNGLKFTHGISLFTLIEEDKMDQVIIVRELEDLDGLENGMGAELIYDVVGGLVKAVTSEDGLTINSSDEYSDIESFLDTLEAIGFKFEYKPPRTVQEVLEEIKSLESLPFIMNQPNYFIGYCHEHEVYKVLRYSFCEILGTTYMTESQAQRYVDELNEIIGGK